MRYNTGIIYELLTCNTVVTDIFPVPGSMHDTLFIVELYTGTLILFLINLGGFSKLMGLSYW